MADAIGGNIAKSPLAKMYAGVDWPTVICKTGELNRQDRDWFKSIHFADNPWILTTCGSAMFDLPIPWHERPITIWPTL